MYNSEDSPPHARESGRDYASKFALLQEIYRKPDGSKWRPVDLHRETNGLIKSSWMTAFTKGAIKRPGMPQLEAIARVMGFPFDFWRIPPERWSARQEDHRGRNLQQLLKRLLESQVDPLTGKPLGPEDVAARSAGNLSEADVRAMLTGELTDPTRNQLRSLSDVFGVRPSYWFGSASAPLLDPETEAAAREAAESESMKKIFQKSMSLSDEQKDILLLLMEQLVDAQNDEPN